MTIYLKDGGVENCLSDEHKAEFWEDLIERCLGRDALTFYQNDIQTEAKEALEEQLSDLQLKLVHASEHLEEKPVADWYCKEHEQKAYHRSA